MKEKTLKKATIITISCLLILLIVGLTLGITGAYYGSKREISGQVNLSPGIKVDFKNDKDQITIDYDEKTNEFWLMKYDVDAFSTLKTDTTISRLNVTGIREGAEIAIVSPEMKSLTTDEFYIRSKLIIRNSENQQELTSAQMLEMFGSTTCPILFNNNWLVDENNEWNYYVGTEKTSWTGGVANKNDILKVQQNAVLSFLTIATTADGVEYVPLTIPNDKVEHFPVTGFEIILQIQAVEAEFVDQQFFA